MAKSKLLRMDNVAIIVQDLKSSISFFQELGLLLEGEMSVEGAWVDRIVAIQGVQNDVAMMRTPDGDSRLELIKFTRPAAINSGLNAPVNAMGIRRMMFAVSDIDDVLERLRKRGAELIGEVVQYGDAYRLCYLRGPDGVMIALAEELGKESDAPLPRLDNVLIVVEDLKAAEGFFAELGLEFEGEPVVEGSIVDRLLGLENVKATLGIMRTPDGRSRIELDKFHSPDAVSYEPSKAPVNTLGIRRLMFAVTDIDDVIARLQKHGAYLVGEVVKYGDMYRLCYVRTAEGFIVALAEELKKG